MKKNNRKKMYYFVGMYFLMKSKQNMWNNFTKLLLV